MKFAICNELFEGWDFARTCETIRSLGYTGIEIAPFTLAPLVTQVSAGQRQDLVKQAAQADVAIVGLHWLLAKVEGFHLNSPDPAVRRKTADYLREQVRLCGEIGGSLMVFGSPTARALLPGVSRQDGMNYAADCISQFLPALDEHNVTFCLEPLSPAETNFLNTADEAASLMKQIGHPRIAVHLDVKAMSSEAEPIPNIIHAHRAHTGHFHANDPNMRGPGMGDVDFAPIFEALRETNYQGWVSVEVFDFKPDPVTIATESIEYMKRFVGNHP